jgi:peptide/nickel transport system ATP-binding protein
MPLLEVKELTLGREKGNIPLVKGISFCIEEGEIYGLLGESGSGKTITALSIIRLLPPGIKIYSGKVFFKGRDLLELSEAGLRKVRGKEIALILQDPLSALNPVLTIEEQLTEVIEGEREERRQRAISLLKEVGLPDPEVRLKNYPHELSGGMRQRVMIAISLARDPELLIADEPTTALDLTLQIQIMKLLLSLNEKKGLSILFITHDLGVMRWIAHRVGVLYKGLLLEEAPVEELFKSPLHPYTKELMNSYTLKDSSWENKVEKRENKSGCPYFPYCPEKKEKCYQDKIPPFKKISSGRRVRCWLYEE